MAYKINNTFGTLLVTLADGTIDTKIHERLYEKYLEMGKALDDPWIQQLDYDGTEQKINEKQLGQDFESLIQHLRDGTKQKTNEKQLEKDFESVIQDIRENNTNDNNNS